MDKEAKNKNLHKAKEAKQDEFYTQLDDISRELNHYRDHFKGKVVYCNCDDPYESNFFKFFAQSFNVLGLKKLIATCYIGSPISNTELSLLDNEPAENKTTKVPHKIIINELTDENNDATENLEDIVISLTKNKNNTLTRLKEDGDFRSAECIDLLKQADIVVTNPPFSLFREYVAQLIEYDKKFLIIGNDNCRAYKEIFRFIKENKLWCGYNHVKEFLKSDKTTQQFGNISWYTNLENKKRNEEILLHKNYNPEEYPKYDNYDAIEVSKISDIPIDYAGTMGVPITFLDKYNPDQFEIIGITKSWDASCRVKMYPKQIQVDKGTEKEVTKLNDGAVLKLKRPVGKTYYKVDNEYFLQLYVRILIRNKRI